jgi:hypothetical protein
MHRHTRRRGYALALVLVVLLLISIAVGSLSYELTAAVAETRRTVATIRSDDACTTVLDLTARVVSAELAADPATDADTLLAKLCTLGSCVTILGEPVPTYLAPPTSDLHALRISYATAARKTIRPIPTGAFVDRLAEERSLIISVAATDRLTSRPCSAVDRVIVPAVPLSGFPIFGAGSRTRWSPPLSVRRINDGAPSRIHLNGNTGGLTASDFDMPGGQFSPLEPAPVDLTHSTSGADRVLAPAVQAPVASAAQAGVPRPLRWLIEPPRPSDAPSLREARLATMADVVVVDGVWYDNSDKSLPWPGRVLYSDHGGTAVHTADANAIVDATGGVGQADITFTAGVPRLFSWYDRDGPTQPIRTQTVGGVLSYGPVAIVDGGACTDDDDCGGGSCVGGICKSAEPAAWTTSSLVACGAPGFHAMRACSHSPDAALAGARSGFRDHARNILPINIDVAALGQALQALGDDELGPRLDKPFNGILYIASPLSTSTLPDPGQGSPTLGPDPLCVDEDTGVLDNCPGNANTSEHRPRASRQIPRGLCSSEAGTAGFGVFSCSSDNLTPNAVRVINARRVDPRVFPFGLTIATDLPLYVYGDVNRVDADGNVKVAFAADRVTFLSLGWRDQEHPWHVSPSATLTPTGQQIVEASLVTGVPRRGGDRHDVEDVFRTPQVFLLNHFLLRGHIAIGWNAELLDDVDDVVDGGLRWLPDYHLDTPSFGPPGMPLLNLPPSGHWRQR